MALASYHGCRIPARVCHCRVVVWGSLGMTDEALGMGLSLSKSLQVTLPLGASIFGHG